MVERHVPVDIGSRLELFVDNYIIDRLSGAALAMQKPTPKEVALTFDEPWEGPSSAYISVIKDADFFSMRFR